MASAEEAAEKSKKDDVTIYSHMYSVKYCPSPGVTRDWHAYIGVSLKYKNGGDEEATTDFLSLYFHSGLPEVTVEVEGELAMSIPGSGDPLETWSFRKTFGDDEKSNADADVVPSWGIDNFMHKDKIPKEAGRLFVRGHICVITDHQAIVEANTILDSATKGSITLSADLAQPKLMEKYSDFAVVSRQGDRLPFAWLLLAARSPVFQAMLDSEKSAEVISKEVVISEFGTVSLSAFLNFLITDTIDVKASLKDTREDDEKTNVEVVQNLLILGDKYDVMSLVNKAEVWLEKNMTTGNVVATMQVAHLVDSDDLVKVCLGFMVRNRKEKELSMEALKASKLHPDLWSQILSVFK